jgi:hypothetical protein
LEADSILDLSRHLIEKDSTHLPAELELAIDFRKGRVILNLLLFGFRIKTPGEPRKSGNLFP